MNASQRGRRRLQLVLEPVSGTALHVAKGEILRITQVHQGQSVSFNCFNINDYKERMSVGHMRRENFHPRSGQIIWSNPPRYRPMMKLVHLSRACCVDTLAPCCTGVIFEDKYGIEDHPNCQDTLAEAIGEYGLTPDDVHDPLNFWMNTEVDHVGYYPVWGTGQKNDCVDLLAVMDVLAVPAICGGGNLSVTNDFSYKPIRVEIFEKTEESEHLSASEWEMHTGLKSQQLPENFKNQRIRTAPELSRDPSYKAAYLNFPIEWTDIEVFFSDEEFQTIWTYRGRLGDTDEEVVRTLFFHWYLDNRKRQGLRWYSPQQSHS